MAPRRTVLILAAVVLAVLAGWGGRVTAPNVRAPHDAATLGGPSRESAQNAATRLVVLLGKPATLLGRGSPVLRAITAPEGSTVVDERVTVPAALEAMTGLLGDVTAARPVVAHVAPLASRVIGYSGAEATVEVWTVSILGTRRLGVVSSSWSTETVSLAWRDGWQVTDVRARPGPTPAPAGGPVTSLPQFLAAVDGMRRYDDARR